MYGKWQRRHVFGALARTAALRTWRGGRYLLGTLVAALGTLAAAPVLCVPALAQPWAERQRRHAGGLLGQHVEARPRPAVRNLAWLATQVGFGLPAGALALLLVGCLAATPFIAGLWWAFPRAPWLPVVS